MPKLDKQFIKNYYQSLQNFIKRNFETAWLKTQQLKNLSMWKMKILTLINPQYQQNLTQFKTYKLLTQKDDGTKLDLKQINTYLLALPLNQSLENLKLQYLKTQAQKNIEYLKTYLINQANKLATQGQVEKALKILKEINF